MYETLKLNIHIKAVDGSKVLLMEMNIIDIDEL